MEIETIITELQKLNLSQYPEQEIRALLNNIGKMASMQVNFHPGKVVMRARPHANESVRFSKKSDFSFKPQQFNKSYQRARRNCIIAVYFKSYRILNQYSKFLKTFLLIHFELTLLLKKTTKNYTI